MNPVFERQLHLFVVIAIVCLATAPTWFAEAATPDLETNFKAGKSTDELVVEREAEANNGYSAAEKKLLQNGETHKFQAEVNRLMSLIVNSIYSNKDIFLRELISNASDALDKIRFLALTNPALLEGKPELEIRIRPNVEAGTIEIIDTGVGMTKDELIANLGTIAKSGTSEFMASSEGDTSSLIGQFGVGFYSSYLVADRVTVVSKSAGDKQHIWSSDSHGVFVVGEDTEGESLVRGTSITLHLREDAKHFLEQETLQNLISRYSEFINFPIYLWTSHVETHEIEKDEAEEDFDGVKVGEEEEEEEEGEDEEEDWAKETVEETVWEWTLLNNIKPLWTRDPSEVTDEEYINFYKVLAKKDNVEDPYIWTHFTAEGDLEFRAILYIPQEVPDDMFNANRNHDKRGLKLYVRRVFITDEFDSIIPKYLSFVKGIVDSNTLPLNVSREILQQDRSLKLMEKKLIRKIIGMIQKLAQDDEEAYNDFYDDYKLNLKLGVLEDKSNQDRLAKLLRFQSSKGEGNLVSFDQYIERMKEGQNKIYYLAGESKEVVANSPLLEKLIERDYEVLYFTDSIDEYWTQSFREYEGHELVNISKDVNLDLGEDETEEKVDDEEFKPLLEFFKSTLKTKISKAVLSKRLTSTPTALISTAYSFTANMERIQRAQALGAGVDSFMASKKVLEVNPKHELVQQLRQLVESDPDSQVAKDMAQILFDTAALHSGFSLDDPAAFAKSIHRMINVGLAKEVGSASASESESESESEHDHKHEEL